MDRIKNIIITILFILILGFFFSNQYIKYIVDDISVENRAKIPAPEFDIKNLDNFPDDFNNYFEDHFSIRNRLISFSTWLNKSIFKKSIFADKVIIGRNDWMYIIPKEMDNYMGKNLFTNNELQILKKEFLYRQEFLRKRNIKLFIFAIPDKYSVYPENLPHYIQKPSFNRTKQLYKFLKENSDINFFVIDDSLKKHKNEYQLYYKYDNHWNNIGGFYGSKAITSLLIQNNLKGNLYKLHNYKIDSSISNYGNLSNMLPGSEEYLGTNYKLTPTFIEAKKIDTIKYPIPENFGFKNEYQTFYSNNNPELSDLLIFHDSFGLFSNPYLKNNFNNTTFIFDKWLYGLNPEIIDNEKPDAVVYLILENLLQNILNNLSYQ